MTDLNQCVSALSSLANEFNGMQQGGQFRVVSLPETQRIAEALDCLVAAAKPAKNVTELDNILTLSELSNNFRRIAGSDFYAVNHPETIKYGTAIKAVLAVVSR